MSHGEIAYRAYGDAVGWTNWQGKPMPPWLELPPAIRDGWDAAAQAVLDRAGPVA